MLYLWWAQSKTVSYSNNNKLDPKEGCNTVSHGEPDVCLARLLEPKNEIIIVTHTHIQLFIWAHLQNLS